MFKFPDAKINDLSLKFSLDSGWSLKSLIPNDIKRLYDLKTQDKT